MNCPQCGAKVAAGEAICPKCDFILDASFLGSQEAFNEEDDAGTELVKNTGKPPDRTNIGAMPQQSASKATGARPAVKVTGASAAVKKPMTTGAQKAVNKAAPLTARPARAQEPETDAATNVVPPKSSAQRGPPPADENTNNSRPALGDMPPAPSRTYSGMQMVAPDKALDEFRYFVAELPLGDKVAFVAAAFTILTTFLPWKETAAEGEILGLMSLGIIVFLVMAAVIASIVIRVRRVMPHLHPLVPWLVQLGGTAFSGLWCIIYIGLSIDSRKTQALVGNFEVSVSAPAFGVFLAVIGCGATIAGTLMGLKARPT